MSEKGETDEKLKAGETVMIRDIDDYHLDDGDAIGDNKSPSASTEGFRGFDCDQVKNFVGFENVQLVPKKHKLYNSVREYKIFPKKGRNSKASKNETSHDFNSEVKRGCDTVNDVDVGEIVTDSIQVDASLKCPMCAHVSTTLSDLDAHLLSHKGKAVYSCPHCDMRFTTDEYLREHSLDHGGIRVYKCAECEFITTIRGTFYTHSLIHVGVRPHECSSCGRPFRTHSHLKNHERRHTGDKPYSCPKCDYRARGINALKSHMLTKVHNDKKPYKCSICSAGFSDRRHLLAHMVWHSEERPFSCSTCGKVFKTKQCLGIHSIVHKSVFYYCSYCEFRSKHKAMVKHHERIHTGDRSHRKLECHLCGLRTDKKGLRHHMLTHGEARAYRCSRCDFRSKTKCGLRSHEKRHTGSAVTCSVCQKKYTTNESLKYHYLTHHTKERPFKCSLCDFACVEKRRLKIHVMRHTGETPYHCEICSKGFITVRHLGKHRRTVHGEKEIQCSLCDHRTKYRGNLVMHIRRQHDKERAFKCDVCPQTFIQKNAFVAHKLQHSGLRPFKCDLCSYAGVEKRSLKGHMMTHRNDSGPAKYVARGPDLRCSVCPFLARGKVHFRKHLLLHVKQSCVKLYRIQV